MFKISYLLGNCFNVHSEISTFRGTQWKLLSICVCVNLNSASKITVNLSVVYLGLEFGCWVLCIQTIVDRFSFTQL